MSSESEGPSLSFSLSYQGRGIFASGSPFSKVTLPNGQTFFPGQGNNAYVFPGVALGVIACGVRHISDDIFLITAEVSNWHLTNVFKKIVKRHMHLLQVFSRTWPGAMHRVEMAPSQQSLSQCQGKLTLPLHLQRCRTHDRIPLILQKCCPGTALPSFWL